MMELEIDTKRLYIKLIDHFVSSFILEYLLRSETSILY
jgi:hypothetical protein